MGKKSKTGLSRVTMGRSIHAQLEAGYPLHTIAQEYGITPETARGYVKLWLATQEETR